MYASITITITFFYFKNQKNKNQSFYKVLNVGKAVKTAVRRALDNTYHLIYHQTTS